MTEDVLLTAEALLFDMDGTLVDSTTVVERTWHRFARRHGLDGAEILADAHGRRTGETVARHLPTGGDVAAETARLVAEEVADVDGIVQIPGAAELLACLPAGRWAVVTSAGRELARRRMAAAGLRLPDVVVSAEDVRQGKPDPEGYSLAARHLGVPPEAAIVFEDAEAGLLSALASGARAVVVGAHGGRVAADLPRVADLDAVTASSDGERLRVRLAETRTARP